MVDTWGSVSLAQSIRDELIRRGYPWTSINFHCTADIIPRYSCHVHLKGDQWEYVVHPKDKDESVTEISNRIEAGIIASPPYVDSMNLPLRWPKPSSARSQINTPIRHASNYQKPSPERTYKIMEMRYSGKTLREIGCEIGLGCEGVRQTILREERRQKFTMKHWRPTICHGHPSFNDPYGIDQITTLEQQYTEDHISRVFRVSA
jgi:hypothetical protein